MKLHAFGIFAVAVAILLGVTGAAADVFIHGYVKCSGVDPIQGAHVRGYLSGVLKFDAVTDTAGYYYVLPDTLSGGSYQVTASKPEYTSQTKTVSLPTQNYVNFSLLPAP